MEVGAVVISDDEDGSSAAEASPPAPPPSRESTAGGGGGADSGANAEEEGDVRRGSEDAAAGGAQQRKKKPKKPLSAYNMFFREEKRRLRKEMLMEAAAQRREGRLLGGGAQFGRGQMDGVSASNNSSAGSRIGPGKSPLEQRRAVLSAAADGVNLRVVDVSRIIHERWQCLGSEKLETYRRRAEEGMELYKAELREFKIGGGHGGGSQRDECPVEPAERLPTEQSAPSETSSLPHPPGEGQRRRVVSSAPPAPTSVVPSRRASFCAGCGRVHRSDHDFCPSRAAGGRGPRTMASLPLAGPKFPLPPASLQHPYAPRPFSATSQTQRGCLPSLPISGTLSAMQRNVSARGLLGRSDLEMQAGGVPPSLGSEGVSRTATLGQKRPLECLSPAILVLEAKRRQLARLSTHVKAALQGQALQKSRASPLSIQQGVLPPLACAVPGHHPVTAPFGGVNLGRVRQVSLPEGGAQRKAQQRS